jgi:ribosomal protein S18 acetylase RimI-like enzyme
MYTPLNQLPEQLSKLAAWLRLPLRRQTETAKHLNALLSRQAWGELPYAGIFQVLPGNAPGLLLIYYQPAGITWSLELFNLLHSDDRIGHLFLDGEQRYGAPPNPERKMKIADFVVNGDYRCQGVGSRMLQTSVLLGQQADIRTIWGEIVSTDEVERLIPYYRRSGFIVQRATEPDAHIRATISVQIEGCKKPNF